MTKFFFKSREPILSPPGYILHVYMYFFFGGEGDFFFLLFFFLLCVLLFMYIVMSTVGGGLNILMFEVNHVSVTMLIVKLQWHFHIWISFSLWRVIDNFVVFQWLFLKDFYVVDVLCWFSTWKTLRIMWLVCEFQSVLLWVIFWMFCLNHFGG